MTVVAESSNSTRVLRGLDLIRSCEEYDPRGMLVYIPSLRKYGSYDGEKKSLITFRDMSWSAFCADPVKYINAGWSADEQFAEETFTERDTDRIVEICSAADAAEADAFRATLGRRGIRAEVVGLTLGTAPRVFTREGDAGRARELLQPWMNRPHRSAGPATAERAGPDEVVLRCPDCGIRLSFSLSSRGFVETCPACGADVDDPDDRPAAPFEDAEEAILLDDAPPAPPAAEPPSSAQ